MEFLKQIAEQAEQIAHARLYEGVEQTLTETFDAVVALIIGAEGVESTVAEAACVAMMKDKKEQVEKEEEEEAAVMPAGDEEEEKTKKAKKKKSGLAEVFDTELQAEIALLEGLKAETVEKVYDVITESFEKCVDEVMAKDKNLKKEGKNDTKRKAAEAICAVSAKVVEKKKGAK